ncbi:hypothetical protein [Reichenbachiella sp. MALMAid0571]|uniref:hypothetical protein n=1 Tax=Reichenbachiella sp. MALMAid0571 TaxID=3143939 RepID=UPI0032DFC04B
MKTKTVLLSYIIIFRIKVIKLLNHPTSKNMNKAAKIIISILVVLCAFFILMAQIQRSEAEKQAEAAKIATIQADLHAEEAKNQAKRAVRLAADAVAAENKAMYAQKETERVMVELQKCKSGK